MVNTSRNEVKGNTVDIHASQCPGIIKLIVSCLASAIGDAATIICLCRDRTTGKAVVVPDT